MATTRLLKDRIHSLKREYDTLQKGRDSFLYNIRLNPRSGGRYAVDGLCIPVVHDLHGIL